MNRRVLLSHRFAQILLVWVVGLMLVAGSASAQIDPTAFACDGAAFNVQREEAELLFFFQLPMGFTFQPVGLNLDLCCDVGEQCRLTDPMTDAAIEVNSMGFRKTDGKLYAMELTPTGNNGIIMIDNEGTVTPVGQAGLPGNIRFDAGDVSEDGTTMFINQAGNTPLWVVDLGALTSMSVAIDDFGTVNDWAYNPADGKLYGGDQSDGQVAQLDPVTGTRIDFNVGALPSGTSFGGAWFDPDGHLFLYQNSDPADGTDCTGFPTDDSGILYDIELTSLDPPAGSIIEQQSGPFTEGRNDGAACIPTPPFIGAAKEMTVDPSNALPTTVTIQYAFENFGTMSPADDMTALSAIDNLELIFGAEGVDWTFTSISSMPAKFANPSFDGAAGDPMDPIDPEIQLINQAAPANDLDAGEVKTITVVIELLTIDGGNETPPGSGSFEFCNQVSVQALNNNIPPQLIGDLSFGGPDPDPDMNGVPSEDGPSCINVTPPVGTPCLDLVKTGTLDTGPDGIPNVGDIINYTFDVENCGDVDLTDISVTDPLVDPIDCSGDDTPPQIALLVPMAVETCTGEYMITQADIDSGERCNTASAEGTEPTTGGTVGPVTDEHCEPLPGTPEIQLTKVGTLDDGGDGLPNPGDVINYTFLVENTGNVTVTDILVTDPLVSPITCPSGNPIPSLAPGESEICMGTYVLTQDDIDDPAQEFCNTATAQGTDPTGGTVGPVTDQHCEPLPQDPCINLIKDGVLDDGGDGPDAGDAIDYTFTVENCGNVTLTDVAVTDPLVDPIECNGDDTPPQIASLAPGAMEMCTGSYVLDQADIDNGERCNIADATGTEPTGGTVNDDDEHCEPLIVGFPDIPTLGHIGLLLLALGLAGIGARRLRRQH